jgi:hypothetical protein
MRSEKELLQILLDNMDLLDTGLCRLSGYLRITGVISIEEELLIDRYFTRTLDVLFTYSFPEGEKEPRIKWLKEQIDKLP